MDITLTRTVSLLGVAILVAIIARRLRLPYTVGLVITGIGLAVARLDTGAMLTHDFIFDVVLPPLLFEAALSIDWRELRRDLVVVLTLSTLGVVISAARCGGGNDAFPGLARGACSGFQRSNRRNRSHCRHRHVQGYRHQGPTPSPGRE